MLVRNHWRCLAFLAALWAVVPAGAQARDQDAEAAAAVQTHLGLFLALENRRESNEGVTRSGERLEIWFLRPIGPDGRDDALCAGSRWLLTGRLSTTRGARGLFEALPDLQEVALVFYRLETQVKPDAEGRYTQTRDASPEARFTISREKAMQLDPAVLRGTLVGSGCASAGPALLDGVWTP